MAAYEIALLVTGLAILGAVVLPRILADKPVSFPLLYVGLGALVFSLPTGVSVPDPATNPNATRRLTELVIIISLMGAGLKLDRPFDAGAAPLRARTRPMGAGDEHARPVTRRGCRSGSHSG